MELIAEECKAEAKQYRRKREWLKAAIFKSMAQRIIKDRRIASLRKSEDVSLGIVKRPKTVASPLTNHELETDQLVPSV